ncbi:zinc finger protein 568 [Teleopsis dalmanni]|uniref:zinc finger protein 568 n=1 Tax=Teleopsis dalmanni TaxID=139649 RepID=UPI0018CEE7D6|nr:zinc finger protein 568 [Teleopsis dalmanni]XP_037950118.1 zinc finger protein 568 [Teleopsis dalmanni]
MDLDKICFTCLTNDGPFISIYDDSSGIGKNCIADMLNEFTKSKPKRAENVLPKVCLTCLREINRCYSFKLKCDNSIRALAQLIPDIALAEDDEPSPVRVQTSSKASQTTPEVCQRNEGDVKVNQLHQHVKADPVIAAVLSLKSKNTVYRLENENIKPITPKSEKLESLSQIILNRKFQQSFSGVNVPQDEEVVIEYAEVSSLNKETPNISQNLEDQNSTDEIGGNGLTYIEITEEQYEDNVQASTNIEDEYNNIYIETTDNEQHTDYDITIYDNENGEAEIVAKPILQQQKPIASEDYKIEYKCPYCIMTFAKKKNLSKHLIKRHEKKPDEEEMSTPLHITLLQQIDNEANSQKATIEPKREINGIKQNTEECLETVVDEKVQLSYICNRCNAGFAQRKALNYHLKSNICTMKSFKCDECKRVFISEVCLKEHKRTHLYSNVCSECSNMFNTKEELSEHMIAVHRRKQSNQCTICKKVFTMLSALKDHMRIHSGERPFVCHLCNKGFTQKANLNQHILRHSNAKNFICDVCSQAYVTKAELYSHKRIHTGDQPFKCEFCNVTFSTSSTMELHKRKHTGERPYPCSMCKMRFTRLNVLKNHLRTHTGEKPFKCKVCKKAFTQRGDCQIHQRTHTGEKVHECKTCGDKFTHLPTLRTHLKSHKNENTTRTRTRRSTASLRNYNEETAIDLDKNIIHRVNIKNDIPQEEDSEFMDITLE